MKEVFVFLKPCAYCGGKAYTGSDEHANYVRCGECGSEVRGPFCSPGWHIKMWNTRVADDVSTLSIEELRRINKVMEPRAWVWIEVLEGGNSKSQYDNGPHSAYYQVQLDWTDGRGFTCGTPGVGYCFKYADYGVKWTAYRYEPARARLLTPDDLAKMYDEPVWVELLDVSNIADPLDAFCGWGMVRKGYVRLWDASRADIITVTHSFEDCGTVWVPYTMKPSGSIKEEVSCTTRPKREGETDGVEYHFVSLASFLEARDAGKFFESSEYNGNLYGTLYSELEEKTNNGNLCVMILDIPGAIQIKAKFPGACALFLYAPLMVLESRLRGRATDAEEVIQRRLDSAKEEMGMAFKLRGMVYDELLESKDIDDLVLQMRMSFPSLRYDDVGSPGRVGFSIKAGGEMIRLTEFCGDRWIARQERLPDGTIVGDKMVCERLAQYENLRLLPEEIKSLLRDGGVEIAMRNRELKARLAALENKG